MEIECVECQEMMEVIKTEEIRIKIYFCAGCGKEIRITNNFTD